MISSHGTAQDRPAVPQYQLEELSGEEDEALVQETHQPHAYQYKVPAGVRNLHQWGQETFSSGKHKGKTFAETFKKDSGYVQFIVHNTRLTSTDMLSFQNYTKAMSSGKLPNRVQPRTGNQLRGRVDACRSSIIDQPIEDTEKNKRGYSTTTPSQMVISDRGGQSEGARSPDSLRRERREIINSKSPRWNADEVYKRCQELIHNIEDCLSTLPKNLLLTFPNLSLFVQIQDTIGQLIA